MYLQSGAAEGISRLKEFWLSQGFKDVDADYSYWIAPQDNLFHPAAGVFESREELEDAREMFRDIGIELRKSKLPRGKDELSDAALFSEKVTGRALGYNNAGLRIVFYYNTPPRTLTALWQDGFVPGKEWIPLFRRRPKAWLYWRVRPTFN